MASAPQIVLQEYKPSRPSLAVLSDERGHRLWQQYSDQVTVDFPSPRTDHQWQLTPRGWIGHLPLDPDFHLVIQPKVSIGNLFRMLEYAYNLPSFRFLEGHITADTLDEAYERLAHVLARRILDRTRKGLHRTYVQHTEDLPFIRERLDVGRALRRPWDPHPRCHYHHHTADIEDNQLLAWTLHVLRHSPLQRDDVRASVRHAARRLSGQVALQRCTAAQCVGRPYTRLNDDYRFLHALCRFFLEHTGPSLDGGQHTMRPFLVNMNRLFESFVAAWLTTHLPDTVDLHPHDRFDFSNGTYYDIDLVLYHRSSDGTPGAPYMVIDTKYKAPDTPSKADINQILAYAFAKNCREAVLCYPTPLVRPLDETIRHIRLRSLSFDLAGDLDTAGHLFLDHLVPETR